MLCHHDVRDVVHMRRPSNSGVHDAETQHTLHTLPETALLYTANFTG